MGETIQPNNQAPKETLLTMPKSGFALASGPKILVLAIIVVIIAAVIISIFVFNPLQTPPLNDQQDQNTPSNAYACEKRVNLNIGGRIAIFTNTDKNGSLISAKGEKAPYIQFLEDKEIKLVIENTFADENNFNPALLNLITTNSAQTVVFAEASQEMKKALSESNIKCYSVGGTIASYLKTETAPPITIDESYCKKIDKYPDTNTLIAFGANNGDTNSIISAKRAKVPYLLKYVGKEFSETIENTAKDSNTPEEDLIKLLQEKGINTIILAGFGTSFEEKLSQTSITCYEAGGSIKRFVEAN